MNKKVSKHITTERMSRVGFIIDTFKGEFGMPIAESPEGDIIRTLTDKGIIVITGITSGKVVTLWIATVNQGVAIWRDCHHTTVPKHIMKQLHKVQPLCLAQPAC